MSSTTSTKESSGIPKWKLDLQRRKQKKEEEQKSASDLDWKNHINDPVNVIIIPADNAGDSKNKDDSSNQKQNGNAKDGVSDEHCISVKNNPFLRFEQILSSKPDFRLTRYKRKTVEKSDSRSKDDTDSKQKPPRLDLKSRSISVDNLTYELQKEEEEDRQRDKANKNKTESSTLEPKVKGKKTSSLSALRAKFGKQASTQDVLAIIKPKSPKDDVRPDESKKEIKFDYSQGKKWQSRSNTHSSLGTKIQSKSIAKQESTKPSSRQDGGKNLYLKKTGASRDKVVPKPVLPSKNETIIPSTPIDLPSKNKAQSSWKGNNNISQVPKTNLKLDKSEIAPKPVTINEVDSNVQSKVSSPTEQFSGIIEDQNVSPRRRRKKRLSASELIKLNAKADDQAMQHLKRPPSIVDGGEDFFPVFPLEEKGKTENAKSTQDVNGNSEDSGIQLLSVKPLNTDLPVVPNSVVKYEDQESKVLMKPPKETKPTLKDSGSKVHLELKNVSAENKINHEESSRKIQPDVKTVVPPRILETKRDSKEGSSMDKTTLKSTKFARTGKEEAAREETPAVQQSVISSSSKPKVSKSDKNPAVIRTPAVVGKDKGEAKNVDVSKNQSSSKSETEVKSVPKSDILPPHPNKKTIPLSGTNTGDLNLKSKLSLPHEKIHSNMSPKNSSVSAEKEEAPPNPFAVKLKKVEGPSKGLTVVRKATGGDNSSKRVERRDPSTLLKLQVNGEIPVTNIDDLLAEPIPQSYEAYENQKAAVKKSKFNIIGGNASTGKPPMQTSKSERNRNKANLKIRFDDKVATYEYPSESSVLEEYTSEDVESVPYIPELDDDDDKGEKEKSGKKTSMFSEGFQHIRKCDDAEISTLLGRGPPPPKPARHVIVDDPPSSPEPEPNFAIRPMDSGNYFSERNDTALLF